MAQVPQPRPTDVLWVREVDFKDFVVDFDNEGAGPPEESTTEEDEDFVEVRRPFVPNSSRSTPSTTSVSSTLPSPGALHASRSSRPPSNSHASPIKRKHAGSVTKGRSILDSTAPRTVYTPEEKKRYRQWVKKHRKNVEEVQGLKDNRALGPWAYLLTDHQRAEYSSPKSVRRNFDAESDLRATKGAFQGYVPRDQPEVECTLKYCKRNGYTLEP